jgi:nucleotide-binding universal stress UspA family protein
MLTLTRILCATDFSDVSAKAERYAIALAKHYEARLVLLHVDPPMALMAPYGEIPIDIGVFEEQRRQADLEMRAAQERARAAGVTVDATLRGGAPAREILAEALHGVDLIVIGTHGRGGMEHFLLGSVAEKVLRKAQCPVMIVPAAADVERGARFSRILVPIDGSAPSAAAVEFAVSLARETDGTIRLLEVVEPLPVVSEIDGLDARDHDKKAEERARRTLQGAIGPDVREWCRVVEEVAFGKASQRILDAARDRQSDVVVMGVRGRNALDLFAFGSTTNDVVRRAECPVLVVHPRPAGRDERRGLATVADA